MKTTWTARLGRIAGCALIAIAAAGNAQAARQAYMSAGGEPWSDNSNVDAMGAAFGSDWDRLQYGESFNDYALLYIDGGSESASEMVTFLDNHRGQLESYALGGGRLFINAATEFQTSFGLVFGATSTEHLFEDRSTTASAVNPSNALFDGAGSSWEGYYFSHNSLHTPNSFSALIRDDFGRTVLSGGHFGDGYVMLGTQTNTSFHASIGGSDPFQLRVNELLYTLNTTAPPDIGSPVPEPETAAMLLLGLGGVAWLVRRRKLTRPR